MQHHATVYASSSLSTAILPTQIDSSHVDTEQISCDRFGIDDVRALRQVAFLRPVSSQKRTFIIVTQQLPIDAQNALLKLFEDPPDTAEFHLLIPSLAGLLPTLRSRVQLVETTESFVPSARFAEFYAATYGERIQKIATLAKTKDTTVMKELFDGAVFHVSKAPAVNGALAKRILFLATQAATPGASKKMLLEELALSLPLPQ